MSFEKAKAHLEKRNLGERIKEFPVSSATVELAAQAAGVIPARICKTISFKSPDGAILVCTAGDTKIDNKGFKEKFGVKAKMLSPEEVVEYTGHEIGGVCAFGIENPNTKVYADVSLKRFDTVFPACGSSNSAVEMTPDELYDATDSIEWVDVCKNWRTE